MTKFPVARSHNAVVQNLPDEVLIYDLNINKAYCLNSTSALIYRLCDGNHSIADISQNLTRKLNQPVSEEIVRLALDEMKKQDLLSNGDELDTEFEDVSRRDLIRRIGFTSVLALPLISTVIAPTAVSAQSACTDGGFPNSQGNCPVNQRCVGGNCQACLINGTPLLGGCNLTTGALCCSVTCDAISGTCIP